MDVDRLVQLLVDVMIVETMIKALSGITGSSVGGATAVVPSSTSSSNLAQLQALLEEILDKLSSIKYLVAYKLETVYPNEINEIIRFPLGTIDVMTVGEAISYQASISVKTT